MRNPLACWHMRGHMAGAVYDDLDAGPRNALNRHLASCGHCRAEFQQLKLVARAIPAMRPELNRDLTSVLQNRLAEESAPTRRVVPRLAWAGATVAIIAGL